MPKTFASDDERRAYHRRASRRWYARNRGHHVARYGRAPEAYGARTSAARRGAPEKNRARSAVSYAVRVGKISKPATCSRCGQGGKICAHHHHGYARRQRLDVIWLCTICHGLDHRID